MSEPAVSSSPELAARHRARVHWAIFLPLLVWGAPLLLLGLFYLGAEVLDGVFVRWPIAPSVLAKKGWIVFALVALWLGFNLVVGGLRALIAWLSTEIAVHDRKVTAGKGLIRRVTLEQRLGKVDAVVVDQGLFGRLFNFGTVDLRGGKGGLAPLTWIADPAALKSAIEQAIEDAEARDRREAAEAAYARAAQPAPVVLEPEPSAQPDPGPVAETPDRPEAPDQAASG